MFYTFSDLVQVLCIFKYPVQICDKQNIWPSLVTDYFKPKDFGPDFPSQQKRVLQTSYTVALHQVGAGCLWREHKIIMIIIKNSDIELKQLQPGFTCTGLLMVSFFLKNIELIYLQYLSFPLKSGLTAQVSLRLCAGGIATVKLLLLMAEGWACGLADYSCGRVDAILMSVVHHTCKSVRVWK